MLCPPTPWERRCELKISLARAYQTFPVHLNICQRLQGLSGNPTFQQIVFIWRLCPSKYNNCFAWGRNILFRERILPLLNKEALQSEEGIFLPYKLWFSQKCSSIFILAPAPKFCLHVLWVWHSYFLYQSKVGAHKLIEMNNLLEVKCTIIPDKVTFSNVQLFSSPAEIWSTCTQNRQQAEHFNVFK